MTGGISGHYILEVVLVLSRIKNVEFQQFHRHYLSTGSWGRNTNYECVLIAERSSFGTKCMDSEKEGAISRIGMDRKVSRYKPAIDFFPPPDSGHSLSILPHCYLPSICCSRAFSLLLQDQMVLLTSILQL